MTQPKITVVGACNMDLISYVPRLPGLGETLHGERFSMGFGGKGANQAVMAARLGARVSMVTKLGKDVFGDNTRKNLESQGVDLAHVLATDKAFSGVAPIAVDTEGNNSIIIVTGANDHLTLDEIRAAEKTIAASSLLVCQLEIPLEINLEALRIARKHGVPTIFNPAPARADLPKEVYELSDIFCPNEPETALLTGMPVNTPEEAEAAAREILSRGPRTVLLTLGERGSLLVDESGARHVAVEPVKATDTTGAGDCFVGSLAYFLARGFELADAVSRANRIAALSVQAPGTQTSFPRAADLPEDLLPPVAEKASEAPAMTAKELARTIDHTILKAEARAADVDRLCGEAVQYGFASVCVNSGRVAQVAKKLAGTGVDVCAVVGFPLGAMETRAKAFEAKCAVEDGANEIDMVLNVGALKDGNKDAVLADIRAVRQAGPAPVVLKVIIETCLLTEDEKVLACELSKEAGADFVKTSTGFGGGGATVEDVALMRKTVGREMGVKASGGIKDAKTALAMLAAGASRIGAGAGVDIVESL